MVFSIQFKGQQDFTRKEGDAYEKRMCDHRRGGSGMGLACAKYMPKDKCIALSGRTVKKLDKAVAELQGLGFEAHVHACDTSDRLSVRALAEYAASLGNLETKEGGGENRNYH